MIRLDPELKEKISVFLKRALGPRYRLPELLTLGLVFLTVYWFYQWPMVERVPARGVGFLLQIIGHDGQIDARSALILVFFGFTTGTFLLAAIVWLLLFVYNTIIDHLREVVPERWHYLVPLAVFYVLLLPCFIFQSEIKSNILTAHQQVSLIITTARNVNPVIRYDIPAGLEE